jgi:cell division protein FtsI/penicillin-binding protein 2
VRQRIFIAAVAVIVIGTLWSRQWHEPLTYYSSRSYVDRANEMIRRGALKYDCRTEQIALVPGQATEAEKKWFEASYLKNDVDLYNRNRELFGHFFVVDDCSLREINPFLRTIRLPFASTLQWLGNIEYSGPRSDSTLFSANGRTILLNRWSPKLPYREVTTQVGATDDISANSVHFDFAGGGQTPGVEVHGVFDKAVLEQRVKASQSAQIRLLGNAVPEGRIARIQSGDWLHLESEDPSPRSETFLFTGEQVFDRLSVVRTRNATQERTYSEDEPLLRWIGGEDGDEMLTFGEGLARSMSNALQQLTPARAKELTNAFDVQLTIDRRLQTSLDAAFRNHCRELVSSVAGDDPFAASLTVLNGKTGEILAAVSFPSSTDLDAMRPVTEEERQRLLVNHNFKRHPIGSAGKPFVYASIATRQPFLLDLVIDPHQPRDGPDGPEGQHEILQYFVPNGYKLWQHGDRPMDFESAIERSCNKFTVDLATLALAAPPEPVERGSRTLSQIFTPLEGVVWPLPGQHSGIHIGGQELTFPPSLGAHMKDDAKPVPRGVTTTAVLTPGTLERMDEVPFIDTFTGITGARTYAGLAPPDVDEQSTERLGSRALQTMQYDLRPWRKLVERFAEGEKPAVAWKVRAAFQAVSPERVNLRLNQVTDLRNEFVSLLLGGSTSQWTNIQLVEAAARLVTKRQVEASIVHALTPRNGEAAAAEKPPAFPELAVSDAAREAVLRGMRRTVLGAQGTAVAFAPRVRELQQRYPGFNVAVFSKTGSPTVVRPEVKPAAAALAEMVTRGRLFFRDGALAVSSDGRAVAPYARPGRTPQRAAYTAAVAQAARRAAATVGQQAGSATAARITAFTDRFMRYRDRLVFPSPGTVKLDSGLPMPFHVVAGELVLNRDHPIFDPKLDTDSSAVYLLTFVKWRGGGDPNALPTPADLEQEDARVITVALYLDLGPGSTIAVETARELAPALYRLLD